MPGIRVLPNMVVSQIAAGEVIERPASVVKELLENAIDAQSSRIVVELEAAGKKLIRVSDDGIGIGADDVPLALSSHATSKITRAEDLEAITTLGFRGEALAAIASVSDVRLVSRTRDALEAREVTTAAGKAGPAGPTSGPVGTSVEVRNLFRHIPARRKFLKTEATEMGHVAEQVARAALPYPQVHLTVGHNGRSVYELPPTESVRDRIAAFFGSDLAQSLIEIRSEEPAGRLWGLIGPPFLARATTKMQYLFINGRYVRDRSLLHALREAYRGMLEGNRQPVAFAFLTVPPERVDVNVHPTKIEVRLRDAHLLYGQVLAAVRERLLGAGMTPHLAPVQPAGPVPETPEAQTPAKRRERESRVRQAVGDFLRSPSAAQGRLQLKARPASAGTKPPATASAGGPQASAPAPPSRMAIPSGETERPPRAHAIQLHNTYLVAETPEGILIVDQHALHERVLFEEIMGRLEAGPLEGQRLLVPVTLDLPDREMAAIEAHRDTLRQLGIEVAPLGPRSVGIHSLPTVLEKADPAETLRDFLAWVTECEAPPATRQVLEKLVHVAACRGAVKAGQSLRPEEIETLLTHREAAELAATCPHGRPTALVLRKADLEKQFGRDYAAGRKADRGDETLPF